MAYYLGYVCDSFDLKWNSYWDMNGQAGQFWQMESTLSKSLSKLWSRLAYLPNQLLFLDYDAVVL